MGSSIERIEIVDTNVPITAGKRVADIPEELLVCVRECNRYIYNLIKSESGVRVVLDANKLILNEYRKIKSVTDGDSIAVQFLKWIYQYLLRILPDDLVFLNILSENEYAEYPDDIEGLESFDPADKKFIALAFAHKESPVIIEATDSMWWGIKDVLEANGVKVCFLCTEYVKGKFEQKQGFRKKNATSP